MKANSKIKTSKKKLEKKSEAISDLSEIQKATGSQKVIPNPDYSSMESEIKEISDPVSFDDLKKFYGIN